MAAILEVSHRGQVRFEAVPVVSVLNGEHQSVRNSYVLRDGVMEFPRVDLLVEGVSSGRCFHV